MRWIFYNFSIQEKTWRMSSDRELSQEIWMDLFLCTIAMVPNGKMSCCDSDGFFFDFFKSALVWINMIDSHQGIVKIKVWWSPFSVTKKKKKKNLQAPESLRGLRSASNQSRTLNTCVQRGPRAKSCTKGNPKEEKRKSREKIEKKKIRINERDGRSEGRFWKVSHKEYPEILYACI